MKESGDTGLNVMMPITSSSMTSWVLMVWGDASLEGCTDLHIANSTQTAVMCWDELLRVVSDLTLLLWVPPGAGHCLASCGQSV